MDVCKWANGVAVFQLRLVGGTSGRRLVEQEECRSFTLFALSPAVVMAVGCLQMVSEVAVYRMRLVSETSGWCLVLTRGVL